MGGLIETIKSGISTVMNRWGTSAGVGSGDGVGSVDKATMSQYARLFAAGLEGTTSEGLNEPLDAYQQSLWVYKCVTALGKTASGIPLQMARQAAAMKYSAKTFRPEIRNSAARTLRPVKGFRGVCVGRASEGELIETGEAWDFLQKPNSYQDLTKFVWATVGYLYVRGSVAWVMTGFAGRGRKPMEMHVIDGKHVKPQWAYDDSGMPVLLGYIYTAPKTGRQIPLTVDEVKYFSLWDDSANPLGGMAPGTPGRLAIATDYNASLFNAYALTNGCDPDLILRFPNGLAPEKREQTKAALKARHQGPAKAKRPLILEGVAEIEKLSTALKDMEWNESKRTTRLEICALYDVPPVVAGWVDAAGDSSAYTENALKQFYQQAIFPTLDGLLGAMQEIVSRFDAGAVLWWNVEDQPVVQQMRLSRIDSAKTLFAMGVPVADANDLLDLGLPDRPWYQIGFVPAGLVPATIAAEGASMPPLDEGEANTESIVTESHGRERPWHPDQVKDAVGQLWRAFEASYTPLAKRASVLLRRRYLIQQRKLVKLLSDYLGPAENAQNGSKTEKYLAAIAKDESVVARILVDVFDDADEVKKFRLRLAPIVNDTYELGLRQSLASAGVGGAAANGQVAALMHNPAITQAMASDAVRISTRIDAFTRNHLRRSLVNGLDAGEGVRELADRVQTFMGNRRLGALSIARNAVGQSLSTARYEGRVAAGFTHEIWIHSRGGGERRQAHVQAEGFYKQNPKPVGRPFIVNGVELRYPRDPSAPAAETANCQCLAIGKRYAPGQTPKTIDLAAEVRTAIAAGFVTYDDMIAAREAA